MSRKNMNNIEEEQEEEQCQGGVKTRAPLKNNSDVEEEEE